MAEIWGAVGAIAAVGSTAIAGASALGAFDGKGGGTGGVASIDPKQLGRILEDYQAQVDEGINEYQGNLSGYNEEFLQNITGLTNDYRTTTSEALAGYKKSTNKALARYNKQAKRLSKNILGRYVIPQAKKVIGFNEQNMGRFANMAREASLADQQTRFEMLDAAIPAWRKERDQAAQINESLMQGSLTNEIQGNLARDSAYTALQGGFGGSGVARAARARDLGLTTLQLQQTGQDNARAWQGLLADIALPAQTTTADMLDRMGLTSRDAVGAGTTAFTTRLGAAGTTLNSRFTQAGADLSGRLGVEQSVLNTLGNMFSSIYGTNVTSARDIFGTRVNVAEDIAGANIDLLGRNVDSRQAAINLNNARNIALAENLATAGGSIAGYLDKTYQRYTTNKKTTDTAAAGGTSRTSS